MKCHSSIVRGSICLCFWLIVIASGAAGQETQEDLKRLESRALELKARGDAAGALAAWEQAAILDPRSARIQDEIGFLLVVLNRRDDAKDRFGRAIALDPRFAQAHYHLGVVYWLERAPNRSIPELQTAAALAPGNFEYRYLLGHAFNDTSNFKAALVELRAATALNGSNAEAWNELGVALQHNGDATASVEAYQRA